jgi:hypothetical protein
MIRLLVPSALLGIRYISVYMISNMRNLKILAKDQAFYVNPLWISTFVLQYQYLLYLYGFHLPLCHLPGDSPYNHFSTITESFLFVFCFFY